MKLYLPKMTFLKPLLLLVFLSLVLSSCKSDTTPESKDEYLRWVGDIEQNENVDQPDFKACHGDEQILQYFNLGEGPLYPEEKSALLETFETQYEPVKDTGQSGLIRIRFVVNCEGKAGRFRMIQADDNYNEIEFDKRITGQLLKITKDIKSWKIVYRREVPVDYYSYLIFKMNDGQITEILP